MPSDAVTQALEGLAPFEEKKRKAIPVRVKYNGQFVSLLSGKNIWNGEGPAKNALRNHFETILQCRGDERGGQVFWRRMTQEEREEAFQKFLKAVKIVPVGEE